MSLWKPASRVRPVGGGPMFMLAGGLAKSIYKTCTNDTGKCTLPFKGEVLLTCQIPKREGAIWSQPYNLLQARNSICLAAQFLQGNPHPGVGIRICGTELYSFLQVKDPQVKTPHKVMRLIHSGSQASPRNCSEAGRLLKFIKSVFWVPSLISGNIALSSSQSTEPLALQLSIRADICRT